MEFSRDEGVGLHSIYICVHTNIYYNTEYTRYSKINLRNIAHSNVSGVPMNEKKRAAKSELSSFLQICTIYFEMKTG